MPRVARPSEATAFARSVHPSPVPHTSLMSSSSYCALFPQLQLSTRQDTTPQQGDRPGRLGRLSAKEPMKDLLSGPSAVCPSDALCRVSFWEPMLSLLQVVYAGCLSGDRGRVSARGRGRSSVRGTMKSIRLGADEGSPFGGRCRVSFRGQMSSIFMKFTWHANPHYRYL